jgi:hypothetical protein
MPPLAARTMKRAHYDAPRMIEQSRLALKARMIPRDLGEPDRQRAFDPVR